MTEIKPSVGNPTGGGNGDPDDKHAPPWPVPEPRIRHSERANWRNAMRPL